MRHREPLVRATMILLASVAAPAVIAQEAPPVPVSFEFKAPSVAVLFHSDRGKAEARIAEALAARCGERFRYWKFVAATPETFPRLAFWLLKVDSEYRIAGALLLRPDLTEEAWSTVVFPPGEFDIFGAPSAATWPTKVVERFAEKALPDTADKIFARLREHAPLGKDLVPVVPPPPPSVDQARAILPLSWDRYGMLATSEFRIELDWPGHGRVVIRSKGTGLAAQYPGDIPYPALTVQYRTWQDSGEPEPIGARLVRLGEVRTRAFFLEREDLAGGALLAEPPAP